jgi:hypothetical protein
VTSARQLRKTGTDLERMLLTAGTAERPDAESVRRAAKVLGVVPRAALVAATLGIALRATRWTTVAAWSSVPLVGVVGVALVTHHTATPASTPAAATVQAATGSRPPRIPEIDATPAGLPASVEPAAVRDAPEPVALSPQVATRKGALRAVAAGDRLRDQASALDGVRELLALGEPNIASRAVRSTRSRSSFASRPLPAREIGQRRRPSRCAS